MITQRLEALNTLRMDRAMTVMSPVVRRIFRLLPVLLHYEHPHLPGGQESGAPHGICDFTPDASQQAWLDEFGALNTAALTAPPEEARPLIGLYSMGSTSSIGQNATSDLDIWICHRPDLAPAQKHRLLQKCRALEAWAAAQEVKISFFLMDENRFRRQQSGDLSGEDCGSMQHYLLLDEFYRTAIRLAGKPLLWYLIPAHQEAQYDAYVRHCRTEGALQPEDWLDFGGLGRLSAEEYFGASLWQLYKSIDSPYKAVLKTLLLESYSWAYPDTQLLALDFKARLQQGADPEELDAYCMMLQRVTEYLQTIGDHDRLDLARRCFYLKVREKLSDQNADANWRRARLTQLVTAWGWDAQRIALLDNRQYWKVEEVRKAYDELLDALMLSYRNLVRFARRNKLSFSARPQDIQILARKLYAAFEVLPGKITFINPQISPSLAEAALTFIYVPPGHANRCGWYLYNQAPTFSSIISHQPLEYHHYLSKLVAWAYFNGLLTPQTQLYVRGENLCDATRVQTLAADLARCFPLQFPPTTPKALYSPCEIRVLTIIVNLEYDPVITAASLNTGAPTQDEVFNFGAQQQCLVGSMDLVYRNSWNEIRTLHFSGEQALTDALKTILGKMHQKATPPDKVTVLCYSQQWRVPIANAVHALITECIALRLTARQHAKGRFKLLHVAGEIWGIFFERLNVTVRKLEDAVEFYSAISNHKLRQAPLYEHGRQVDLPSVIDGVACEGIVQFFFEACEAANEFTIYILDEHNHVDVFPRCEGSKDELVRDVSRFYSSSHDRMTYSSGSMDFNLPQFYQIEQRDGQAVVVPYCASLHAEDETP